MLLEFPPHPQSSAILPCLGLGLSLWPSGLVSSRNAVFLLFCEILLLRCHSGNVSGVATSEQAGSSSMWSYHVIWQFHPWGRPRGNEHTGPHKNMYRSSQRSIIHNRQNIWKQPNCPNEWINSDQTVHWSSI